MLDVLYKERRNVLCERKMGQDQKDAAHVMDMGRDRDAEPQKGKGKKQVEKRGTVDIFPNCMLYPSEALSGILRGLNFFPHLSIPSMICSPLLPVITANPVSVNLLNS